MRAAFTFIIHVHEIKFPLVCVCDVVDLKLFGIFTFVCERS